MAKTMDKALLPLPLLIRVHSKVTKTQGVLVLGDLGN